MRQLRVSGVWLLALAHFRPTSTCNSLRLKGPCNRSKGCLSRDVCRVLTSTAWLLCVTFFCPLAHPIPSAPCTHLYAACDAHIQGGLVHQLPRKVSIHDAQQLGDLHERGAKHVPQLQLVQQLGHGHQLVSMLQSALLQGGGGGGTGHNQLSARAKGRQVVMVSARSQADAAVPAQDLLGIQPMP